MFAYFERSKKKSALLFRSRTPFLLIVRICEKKMGNHFSKIKTTYVRTIKSDFMLAYPKRKKSLK